ncbi:MAG: hypothetical protein K2N64_04125 [Anaeroplasmataceae bacterium]|nr:hypothetical protein [Anaeroplasmataceae bacterium]
MKPFLFDAVEYQDLNSLGLAFVDKFDMALQVIKEKSFIKFVNKFKQHRTRIRSFLYESHYLQNALSMIIYTITEEHILYVGHHRYNNIEECLKDIKVNPAFKYFAEDYGFSNTLLSTLEDEKLKADILTFEEYFTEDLALDYLESYLTKDSIEPLNELSKISSAKDAFRTSSELFSSYEFQIRLAQRFSLKDAILLRKSVSPVFLGVKLVKQEVEAPLSIIENAFYHFLLDNFKKSKYKGADAKRLYRRLKECKKRFKSYKKHSFSAKIALEERLYMLYLDWVALYKLDKIKIADPSLAPMIPYCGTYICSTVLEELGIEADTHEKEYIPALRCEYDLMKFYYSIKNHRNFSIWSIVFSFLGLILYMTFLFLSNTKNIILDFLSKLMDKSFTDELLELPLVIDILFFVGTGLAVGIAIFILVLHILSKKKYDKLCELSFYRKNEAVLSEAERTEFEILKQKEALYAKKIDRFYRFYGGIGMAGISLGMVVLILGSISVYGSLFVDKLYLVNSYFNDEIYFLAIPPVVCMGLGFLRHKKTSWSIFFTLFVSFLLTAGLVLLMFI